VPDFFVKTADGAVWIVETKGRVEIDVPEKMKRLHLWCADATGASQEKGGPIYRYVYVDQEAFEKHPPRDFAGLAAAFTEYQDPVEQWLGQLVYHPNGTVTNPQGIDDPKFFEDLEEIRRKGGRLRDPFED
jgi:type III restriction enzyme